MDVVTEGGEPHSLYEYNGTRAISQMDKMLEETFEVLDDFPNTADIEHISAASGMPFQAIKPGVSARELLPASSLPLFRHVLNRPS